MDVWHRASRCESGTCVEVEFHKSSYSGTNGACVEAAVCTCGVKVRDSKDPTGPVLNFTREEWSAFLAGVHNREFDL